MIVKVVISNHHMHKKTYDVKLSVVKQDMYFAVALILHAAPFPCVGLDTPFPGRGATHGGGGVHARDALLRTAVDNSAATEVAGNIAIDRL